MARIRSVHPQLYTDEAYAELSMAARVLIIGIWTQCDDHGIFEWKPLGLKMRIFPGDNNIDTAAILAELENGNLVRRFEQGGRPYGAVRNFCKWQKPKKPTFWYPHKACGYDALPDWCRSYVSPEPSSGENHLPTDTETNDQMEDGEGVGKGEKEESNHIDNPVVVVVPREPEKPASTTTTTKAIDEALVKASPLGTALPDDWTPNDHDQRVAASFGMAGAAVEEQLLEFHAYNASRGTFSPDWSATWFRWCSAWKVKQPKEAPRVQLSNPAKITAEQWNEAARLWSTEQRWSRQLGNEPGMSGCKCPEIILTAHGIDPSTGMVKAVVS